MNLPAKEKSDLTFEWSREGCNFESDFESRLRPCLVSVS